MKNKKAILLTITFILFILVFILSLLLIQKYIIKTNYENSVLAYKDKNKKNIFHIDEITYFSSADAKEKNINNDEIEIKNLYQYTDIAIYIKTNENEKTNENTLKNASIENIKIQNPENGTAKLYYKNINNFSKSTTDNQIEIKDKLNFKITNKNEANLNEPILYNNLANPITLSYLNENIKEKETLTNNKSPITYDGNLLKRTNTTLNSIKNNISFDLLIENNLNQKFKTNIQIEIPLENKENNQNIYNGNIQIKEKTNINFFRYE